MREIRIPRLGWSMDEGTFVGWLIQPGSEIAVGQALFELEGEKATQEIESVDAGRLFIPADSPEPGSLIPVGTLVGYLLEPGEEPPQSGAGSTPQPAAVVAPPSAVAVFVSHSPEPSANGLVASPRAQRVAAELGVNWTTLAGSGKEGRIREADVRSASVSGTATPRAAINLMTPRRKVIAERLRKSLDRTVPVTLTTTIDATELVGLRERFKKSPSALVPSYTDMAACVAARVLARNPQFAIRWDADHQNLSSLAADDLHIGIAVDTPDGLLVPVIRRVAKKSLPVVAAESMELIERAREGRLAGADMQGGVFTITNLGGFGIDAFTPIINDPEIAILGLGAIRREAVVLAEDHIALRWRLTLSLTFDHAALDGAPAARLLREISNAMESAATGLES